MNNRDLILKKIKAAHKKAQSASNKRVEARKELADLIGQATAAGIKYREITEILGIGKTGISSILSRSKK